MINFEEYIYPDLVISALEAETKEDVIKVLVDKIFDVCPDSAGAVAKEDVYRAIIAREELQTTGLGQKMAFPHARIKGWDRFVVVMGFHHNGIDFKSTDKTPANFVCLMVSSPEEPYIILQTMSSIIRHMTKKKDLLSFFKDRKPVDIAEDFKTNGEKVSRTIQAKDIMEPIKTTAGLNDEIEDVVRTMHLNRLDVLPVIDERKKFCGEVSCLDIFAQELPNFFGQLHTVSFVRDMDPFQKYFNIKGDLRVSNFFNKNCATINEGTTLIEIVFQLTVKGNSHLFVVKDEKLTGKIDRFSILDNILFF